MMIEGRHKFGGGVGIDLFDLAKMCKAMGAKHAINLDGGGSSQLTWKEKGNPLSSSTYSYEMGNVVVVTNDPIKPY